MKKDFDNVDPNEKYEKNDDVFVNTHSVSGWARRRLGLFIFVVIFFCIVFAFIYSVYDLDDDYLFNNEQEEIVTETEDNDVAFSEEFDYSIVKSINLKVDSANVFIEEVPDWENFRVEILGVPGCEKKFDVNYEGEALNILSNGFIDGFTNLYIDVPEIRVSVPKTYARDIFVDLTLGDVNVGELKDAHVSLKVDSGNAFVKAAQSLEADVECGDFTCENVTNAKVKAELGDIVIDYINSWCDLSAECGDIKVEDLFIDKNSNLKVEFGDIVVGKTNDIKIESKIDVGQTTINGSNPASPVTLTVLTDCGNVNIN